MKKKIIIKIFILTCIMIAIICMIKEKYGDNKLLDEENSYYKETETVTKREYSKIKIDDTYKNFDVCAKLEIPEIELETDILTNFSTQALATSVVKFWGVEPNQEGNFCVVGHNFIRKNMFHNLKNLKQGDIFFISDRKVGRVEYEIFDIYQVLPEDVSCLDAVTSREREVTLITCTSDSKKRIIVKGKERL